MNPDPFVSTGNRIAPRRVEGRKDLKRGEDGRTYERVVQWRKEDLKGSSWGRSKEDLRGGFQGSKIS